MCTLRFVGFAPSEEQEASNAEQREATYNTSYNAADRAAG
jgi:hypothetical protein